MKEESLNNIMLHIIDPTQTGIDLYSRRRIPPSDEYDLLFTILNPEPENLNIEFDIAPVLEGMLDYLVLHLMIFSIIN